jgi:hypothetical protein
MTCAATGASVWRSRASPAWRLQGAVGCGRRLGGGGAVGVAVAGLAAPVVSRRGFGSAGGRHGRGFGAQPVVASRSPVWRWREPSGRGPSRGGLPRDRLGWPCCTRPGAGRGRAAASGTQRLWQWQPPWAFSSTACWAACFSTSAFSAPVRLSFGHACSLVFFAGLGDSLRSLTHVDWLLIYGWWVSAVSSEHDRHRGGQAPAERAGPAPAKHLLGGRRARKCRP